ncbi:hypothetical protein A8C56_17505 [Niabella ginsenosidivorans]|uniref:Transcription elongation factor GreA/GreB C-terminal domain-containing protein n=1 Tax=Niabella ginsenosidivorans TaxID=1176587 RepID=A0A1A9I751_9BACT|nr:hypothetical protein [Niabella ginsenosidivorans]ANH82530.1 hypothetical protein A8C56_17505 [Niabella ginsenosidivorans]
MKKEILDAIIKALEKNTTGLKQEINTEEATATIDEAATAEVDALSQKDEAADLSNLLQSPLETTENTISTVKKYQTVSREEIGPGALVETDAHWLLVGVVLPLLEIKGKKVAGVAPDAPAYATLEGKKKGDQVHLGNREYLILSVQ